MATAGDASADMPAAQVLTAPVRSGQSYLSVPSNHEAWFDVGGFCKVVTVGDLSSLPRDGLGRSIDGVPVFIPGTDAQWADWRAHLAGLSSAYGGRVAVATCCRPQSDLATLCSGATPVDRQYGKLGEVDQVSAWCQGPYGRYLETMAVTCDGDNGPNGQATWRAGGATDTCTPNAATALGPCSTEGIGGWGTQSVTVRNSCGQVQSSGTQSCYVQPICKPTGARTTTTGACSATACHQSGTQSYTTTDSCGTVVDSGTQACTGSCKEVWLGTAHCTPGCDGAIDGAGNHNPWACGIDGANGSTAWKGYSLTSPCPIQKNAITNTNNPPDTTTQCSGAGGSWSILTYPETSCGPLGYGCTAGNGVVSFECWAEE